MTVTLGVFAGILFLTYSLYFHKIILGKPEEFENELLKSLATWMVSKGAKSRPQIWILLFISLMFELLYFTLVFFTINQPVLIVITSFFAGVEAVHFLSISIAFNRFFAGKIMLKDIFKWQVERLSALLFFTHSMLVIISLIFF